MRFRLQTDYALRVLILLAFDGKRRSADEVARIFGISKDHVTKVVQQLARLGYVRTQAGRHGGVSLVRAPREITVREVAEAFESRHGILDCFESPELCPLEPGCRLRSALRNAEAAFYAVLETVTIEDLCDRSGRAGGVHNLVQVGSVDRSVPDSPGE